MKLRPFDNVPRQAALAVLFLFLTCGRMTSAEVHPNPSALAASHDGSRLYVAESLLKRIAVIDAAAGKVVSDIPIADEPNGLALDPSGTRLYVTAGVSQGKVSVVDLAAGKVVADIPVGHTPMSPVLSPDAKTLYVCNRFNGSISVVDLAAGKEVARIPVAREPVAAAVTPDGKHLYVANHLPVGASVGDYIAAVISVIDTATRKVTETIRLPDGSTSLRGLCISPDGKFVLVTHILARYQGPTTQLDRGWMNTNAMSIIDAVARKFVNTVLLDDVSGGAANPWGVACSPDGKFACVAHAGTHELSVIQLPALIDRLQKVAAGKPVPKYTDSANDTEQGTIKPDEVPNTMSFLLGIRDRRPLPGNGPRHVATIGSKVFVAEFFSDTVCVADLGEGSSAQARPIPLGAPKPPDVVRRGEILFNDARMCFQRWQSCATCHPDVRTDGLNWDLLNDGYGNPKNTKSLLLSHQTPPVMAMGVRDTAETAVRAGFKFIQFAVCPEEECCAVDEYLKSLKPVPSPYLVNGELSAAAKRGQAVYKEAGCAGCHPPPLFTNLKFYDVGTGIGPEKGKEMDTPTIVEAWRTAPYLYDGRAATMESCFAEHNKADKHGRTSKLTPDQLSDLVEYVLSQ